MKRTAFRWARDPVTSPRRRQVRHDVPIRIRRTDRKLDDAIRETGNSIRIVGAVVVATPEALREAQAVAVVGAEGKGLTDQ